MGYPTGRGDATRCRLGAKLLSMMHSRGPACRVAASACLCLLYMFGCPPRASGQDWTPGPWVRGAIGLASPGAGHAFGRHFARGAWERGIVDASLAGQQWLVASERAAVGSSRDRLVTGVALSGPAIGVLWVLQAMDAGRAPDEWSGADSLDPGQRSAARLGAGLSFAVPGLGQLAQKRIAAGAWQLLAL